MSDNLKTSKKSRWNCPECLKRLTYEVELQLSKVINNNIAFEAIIPESQRWLCKHCGGMWDYKFPPCREVCGSTRNVHNIETLGDEKGWQGEGYDGHGWGYPEGYISK